MKGKEESFESASILLFRMQRRHEQNDDRFEEWVGWVEMTASSGVWILGRGAFRKRNGNRIP